MKDENKAIKGADPICCNCLKEVSVKKISIGALGWGSQFDNFSTQLYLCDLCLELTNKAWWELKVCGDSDETAYSGESYEYEDEILNFVRQMPLAGQERFFNFYASGATVYQMEPQDWIDYELKVLPHEKCQEYGLFSPQEISAYQDRFPNCVHVSLKTYEDGSKTSKCVRGAYGNKEGTCCVNISSRCYLCDIYQERDGEIQIIDNLSEYLKRETERLNGMVTYAENRLECIKKQCSVADGER